MDIETVIKITTYLSAVLGFLSAEAALVALVRLATGPIPSPDMTLQAEVITSTRRFVLLAFILFCTGQMAREGVVIFLGSLNWGMKEFLFSGAARLTQIVGPLIFVYAITRHQCGQWLWISVLGIAMAFSIVVLR